MEVAGHRIALTKLDRVYWPENKALKQPALTQRDLLAYLAQVSPFMLPHLADRPLTMIRMPEGMAGERFFQKHWTQARPDFVEAITVFSGHKDEEHEYLLCNNLPTLLWLAQSGTLEFHIWHSRARLGKDTKVSGTDYATSLESLEDSILNYPDYVLFDIDPYIYTGKEAKGAEPELNTTAFEKGKEVAFHVRELLNGMGLEPIVKTSGKTGLHVLAPWGRAGGFDEARAWALEIAGRVADELPDRATTDIRKAKRGGRVYIDVLQNARGKHVVPPYVLRPVPGATVSTPLRWDELKAGLDPRRFTLRTLPARLARLKEDPMAPLLAEE